MSLNKTTVCLKNQLHCFEKNCHCYNIKDDQFYTHSFIKPQKIIPYCAKKDDKKFMYSNSKCTKTWLPRETSNLNFVDPLTNAALCFYCYLNESDGNVGELLKIRPMKLKFHLDNETFSMIEPFIKNSGYTQGRIFYRQKIPQEKDKETVKGSYLSWQDIKISEDIKIFGQTYRIVSCDNFTKDFFEERGIIIDNLKEKIPIDPWTMNRNFKQEKKALNFDSQFLESLQIREQAHFPSMINIPPILIFHVAWLTIENDFCKGYLKRTFKMLVHTSNDGVSLTETTPGFNNALFLRTTRLPYTSQSGENRYYRVCHFRPGCWIEVFKRDMLIFDCEGQQTISFIEQQYGYYQYGDCSIEILKKGPPPKPLFFKPFQLVFLAENNEFPNINFIIVYHNNIQQIDIFEANKSRLWTKARNFLINVDASHIKFFLFKKMQYTLIYFSLKTLRAGNKITLFRWTFFLKEAHSSTQIYLDTIDSEENENSLS